jgi:class 3 adenylate cyclase/HAMP domain-containing protein
VKVATKLLLLFLPLLVVPLMIVALSSSLSARNGITNVAVTLLEVKTKDLLRFATTQQRLLEENDLADSPEFRETARAAIESYATELLTDDGEQIIALDESGEVVVNTSEKELSSQAVSELRHLAGDQSQTWLSFSLANERRVGLKAELAALGWTFFLTDLRDAFYEPVDRIYFRSGLTLVIAVAISVAVLLYFVSYLTRPLKQVVAGMRNIVDSGDLSERVPVRYRDETGELGNAFNMMTSALERAYTEIKNYALRTAVAQRREAKIRNVFQKYVPKEVIETFFTAPESMLHGEERSLAILFSDIRSFTTLAEGLSSATLVESLNRYFETMVDVVMSHRGVVDKYIGDAIMAFFGAPAPDENAAQHAVAAALAMSDQLREFNKWQAERERPEFRIGIGINFGPVTIGNIGSERKMDYTVIGDMVNLASRIEGLTKFYGESPIISESVFRYVRGTYPCRMIDRVSVKGRKSGTGLYAVYRELTPGRKEAWKLHHSALQYYYNREFDHALQLFEQVGELLPNDRVSSIFAARSRELAQSPPDSEWRGIAEVHEK